MNRFITAACLALAMFACDDHDHGDDHEHDHDHGTSMSDLQIGCQHFEFGPHHPDFAAATDGELPTVEPHNHYTVAVPAAGGMAQFTPHGPGKYLFMLSDAAATLTLTDASGAAVTPGMTMDPGEECAAAAVVMHFDLEAQAYTVQLGGAASVEVVIHGPIGGEHQHMGGAGGHGHGGNGEGGHGGEHMAEGGHGGEHMAEGGHGGEHMAEGGHGGEHMAEGGHGGEHMAEGGHGGEHMAEGGHGGEHMAEGGHGGEHMGEGGHEHDMGAGHADMGG